MDRLNNRILIKKEVIKLVNGRRQKEELIEFYLCWAEVLDLYGKELYEAMSMKLENTVVFKVRYCRKLEELRNKKDFFIEWQGRKYSIYQADFLGYNKKFIKLKCNEVL
ncbi:phage head closure protein [Clostridium perfringens]|uniref:phage head closure protein n=1 Tax=Clostridium perfringens TaxID=1502 RepID=UPI00111F6905|nr:phage head closure protein [Clostridium perfringens]TPE21312.1 phage head-tail adapter protein [Clostridium perfringens]